MCLTVLPSSHPRNIWGGELSCTSHRPPTATTSDPLPASCVGEEAPSIERAEPAVRPPSPTPHPDGSISSGGGPPKLASRRKRRKQGGRRRQRRGNGRVMTPRVHQDGAVFHRASRLLTDTMAAGNEWTSQITSPTLRRIHGGTSPPTSMKQKKQKKTKTSRRPTSAAPPSSLSLPISSVAAPPLARRPQTSGPLGRRRTNANNTGDRRTRTTFSNILRPAKLLDWDTKRENGARTTETAMAGRARHAPGGAPSPHEALSAWDDDPNARTQNELRKMRVEASTAAAEEAAEQLLTYSTFAARPTAVTDASFLEAAMTEVAVRELLARGKALSEAEAAVVTGGNASTMNVQFAARAAARLHEAAQLRVATHTLCRGTESDASATVERLRSELDAITSVANAKQKQLEALVYQVKMFGSRKKNASMWERCRTRTPALALARKKISHFQAPKYRMYVRNELHGDYLPPGPNPGPATAPALSRNLQRTLGAAAARDMDCSTPDDLVAELEALAYCCTAIKECTEAVENDGEMYGLMTARLEGRIEDVRLYNTKLRAQVRAWKKVTNDSLQVGATITRTQNVSRNAARTFRLAWRRQRAHNRAALHERRRLVGKQQQLREYLIYREHVIRAGVRDQARSEHLTKAVQAGKKGRAQVLTATAANVPHHVILGMTKGYGAEKNVTVSDVMRSIAIIEKTRQCAVGSLEDFANTICAQTHTHTSLKQNQREADERLENREAELSALSSAFSVLQQAAGGEHVPPNDIGRSDQTIIMGRSEREHHLSTLLLKRQNALLEMESQLATRRKMISEVAFCFRELTRRVGQACPAARKAVDEGLAATIGEVTVNTGDVAPDDGAHVRPQAPSTVSPPPKPSSSALGRWKRGIKHVLKNGRRKTQPSPQGGGKDGKSKARRNSKMEPADTSTAARDATRPGRDSSAQALRTHSRVAAFEHLLGAVLRDDVAAVNHLLQEDNVVAVINRRDPTNGTTALIHAAARGKMELVNLLLDANAARRRNCPDETIYESAALHCLRMYAHCCCALLLRPFQDPNIADKHRNTAVHYANASRHLAVAQTLVVRGGAAALHRRNSRGHFPAELLPPARNVSGVTYGIAPPAPGEPFNDDDAIARVGQDSRQKQPPSIGESAGGLRQAADGRPTRAASAVFHTWNVLPTMADFLSLVIVLCQRNEDNSSAVGGRAAGDAPAVTKKKVRFADTAPVTPPCASNVAASGGTDDNNIRVRSTERVMGSKRFRLLQQRRRAAANTSKAPVHRSRTMSRKGSGTKRKTLGSSGDKGRPAFVGSGKLATAADCECQEDLDVYRRYTKTRAKSRAKAGRAKLAKNEDYAEKKREEMSDRMVQQRSTTTVGW